MERWQAKIRKLRQHLKGWAKHASGVYKKEKKDILDKIDSLDKKDEHTHLSRQEVDLKNCLHNRLAQILREEEVKWYQRAKIKELLQGDSNTKYFHLIASGKHRKTRIFQLQDGDQIIKGDEALTKYITFYYKGLFGLPDDVSLTHDIPQVTQMENDIF